MTASDWLGAALLWIVLSCGVAAALCRVFGFCSDRDPSDDVLRDLPDGARPVRTSHSPLNSHGAQDDLAAR